MTKDKIKIYIMAHKKFAPPEEKGNIPLQVGAALHEDLGYLRDDVGENISDRNQNYSELTGLYWIWKNEKEADITGLVHYRRYFLNARVRAIRNPTRCVPPSMPAMLFKWVEYFIDVKANSTSLA